MLHCVRILLAPRTPGSFSAHLCTGMDAESATFGCSAALLVPYRHPCLCEGEPRSRLVDSQPDLLWCEGLFAPASQGGGLAHQKNIVPRASRAQTQTSHHKDWYTRTGFHRDPSSVTPTLRKRPSFHSKKSSLVRTVTPSLVTSKCDTARGRVVASLAVWHSRRQ